MNDTLCKRNYSLDITRIIAVLAVVMIHCSASFVLEYKVFSNEFIYGNLFDSISRIGVPLFLMISGALFLDERKEITLKNILSKNVKNLAIITIAWAVIYSAAYNVILPILFNSTINVNNIVQDIINDHYHMWYLYMIMGLYIATPFLKKFVCEKNKGMVLFFIFISLCFQFLTPVINAVSKLGLNLSFISEWTDKFHLDFFGGYTTYFIVGWYIVNVGIKQKWKRVIIYLLGIISVAAIILYVHFTGDYTDVYQELGIPVFIYSVSLFLAINNISFNLKENVAKKIVGLSKLTFGVYIIHVMVLYIFSNLLPYSKYSGIYIVVLFVSVTVVSFLVSYIISKIPILKKLIKA